MSCRTPIFVAIALSVSLLLPVSSAQADGKTKHVFELFTSQGCYSCPPAEELLGRIVDQSDEILALEFHVDYWDTLVYGAAGQWQDPFSSPKYSQRQRDYQKLGLDGRTGVYTPQMVVDGAYAFVGSKSFRAQREISKDSNFTLEATVEISKDGELTIRVDGDHGASADVWLVSFDKQHTTQVQAGENMGKSLKNSNVVRNLQSIGKWQGEPLVIHSSIEPLADNQDCAVIIQPYSASEKHVIGPILGAAKCSMT